eukprot:UN17939
MLSFSKTIKTLETHVQLFLCVFKYIFLIFFSRIRVTTFFF